MVKARCSVLTSRERSKSSAKATCYLRVGQPGGGGPVLPRLASGRAAVRWRYDGCNSGPPRAPRLYLSLAGDCCVLPGT